MLPNGLFFKPTELSKEDLQLYFGGTVIRIHERGKPPKWLEWGKVEGDSLILSDGKTFFSFPQNDVFLEQTFPVGLFNTKNTVLFGERTGARQVTKGICRANYSLFSLEKAMKDLGVFPTGSSSMYKMVEKSKPIYGPKLFGEIFENQKYFSLKMAITEIRSRKAFARALSNEFALAPHPYRQGDFLVFRNDLPVAELVSRNKIKILVEELRQECSDFFENDEIGVKVV